MTHWLQIFTWTSKPQNNHLLGNPKKLYRGSLVYMTKDQKKSWLKLYLFPTQSYIQKGMSVNANYIQGLQITSQFYTQRLWRSVNSLLSDMHKCKAPTCFQVPHCPTLEIRSAPTTSCSGSVQSGVLFIATWLEKETGKKTQQYTHVSNAKDTRRFLQDDSCKSLAQNQTLRARHRHTPSNITNTTTQAIPPVYQPTTSNKYGEPALFSYVSLTKINRKISEMDKCLPGLCYCQYQDNVASTSSVPRY